MDREEPETPPREPLRVEGAKLQRRLLVFPHAPGHEGQLQRADLEEDVGEVRREDGAELGAPVQDRGEQLGRGIERRGRVYADLHPPPRLLLHLGGERVVVDGVEVARGRNRRQVPHHRLRLGGRGRWPEGGTARDEGQQNQRERAPGQRRFHGSSRVRINCTGGCLVSTVCSSPIECAGAPRAGGAMLAATWERRAHGSAGGSSRRSCSSCA